MLTYPSGAAARLVRTSALARVARLGGPSDTLLEEAFGVKSYAATAVGFVPVDERDVARFVLGVRPPMDPEKSERRLAKALRKADAAPGSPDLDVVRDAEGGSHERRRLFGRRR